MKFEKYFPIIEWLPSYKKENLSKDIYAGLTVGIILIPQGMAYAMIAGLPPVFGLYAALIPQIIYSIFGTSKHISVGPVAMDSMLVASGIGAIAAAGSGHFIELAIVLAFLIGFFQFVFGVLRFGFLVNFLSKPVVSGFTSAAALVIGLNQLSAILGMPIYEKKAIYIAIEVLKNLELVNFWTIGISAFTLLFLLVIKKKYATFPSALFAVTIGTLIVYFGKLQFKKVEIIGFIPKGLPGFSFPNLDTPFLYDLLPIAFTIALIAYIEAISVAKSLQNKHRNEYKIDNNQEMIGLGLSNLIGSFFLAYPTTGGFSRSAVNEQMGAVSAISSWVSALLVGITLLFLTPLFYYLPLAVLGVIIMIAVFGLMDFSYPNYLFKNSMQEFVMLCATFCITLSVGIKEGLMVGVFISIVALVYRTSKPHIAILGKLPFLDEYRNIERYNEVEIRKDVLIVRQDAQLYFANANYFAEKVKEEVHKKGRDLRVVIIHCSSISSVDTTAIQELETLIDGLNTEGVCVYFSGVVGPVRDFFKKTGFTEQVGVNNFFIDIASAVNYLENGANTKTKQMLKKTLQNNVL